MESRCYYLIPLSKTGEKKKKLCKRLFSKLRATITDKYMIYGPPAVLQFISPNSLMKMALGGNSIRRKKAVLSTEKQSLSRGKKKILVDPPAADTCSCSAGA